MLSRAQLARQIAISIHALREEGDPAGWPGSRCSYDFYPRPPRGGRPGDGPGGQQQAAISTHALREEGDALFPAAVLPPWLFLPTPSARRATAETISNT